MLFLSSAAQRHRPPPACTALHSDMAFPTLWLLRPFAGEEMEATSRWGLALSGG